MKTKSYTRFTRAGTMERNLTSGGDGMSETKEIYYDKDQGRFEWIGDRRSPAIEAEISSASYDAPWLEFDGLTPEELCKRWNNHERLVEALRRLARDCDNLEYEAGRVALSQSDAEELLAALEAEKGGEL